MGCSHCYNFRNCDLMLETAGDCKIPIVKNEVGRTDEEYFTEEYLEFCDDWDDNFSPDDCGLWEGDPYYYEDD